MRLDCPEGHRVLVIGLDGGTFDVLRPLLDAGRLPNLGTMVEAGAWGALCSTIPPHSAPAWASFATGANPGRHGVYHFRAIDRQFYEGSNYLRVVNARSIALPTLWARLSQAGKRVGVINVPLTYPPEPVNGFLISGMLTPRSAPVFTFPPELSTSLHGYVVDLDAGASGEATEQSDLGSSSRLSALAHQLDYQLEARTETALRLLREYRPDLGVVVFTETDRLHHFFWPCLDPDTEPPAELQPYTEWARAFYVRLDSAIGRLRATMGGEAVCVIMSDHGFGPAPTHQFYVNAWLRDQGVLAVRAGSARSMPSRLLAWAGLDQTLLHRVLSYVLPKHRVLRLRAAWGQRTRQPIDWTRTQAYFMPLFDFVGGINVVVPRDDARYDQICKRLTERLEALVAPDTGTQIVTQVYHRQEVYAGPFTDNAPDLIFVLDPAYIGDRSLLTTTHFGETASAGRQWTGTHRFNGILAMDGPVIRRGQNIPSAHIQDLAPTILYLMGMPVPVEMDGRVLAEAILPEYLSVWPMRRAEPAVEPYRGSESFEARASTDEAEIVDRLKSLGYLD